MNFDLIIFDCDGVLVDSEPIANRILAESLQETGFPVSYATCVRDYVGLSLGSCFALIEEQFGKPVPDGFENKLQRRTFAAFENELRAIEGIDAAVDAIRGAGARVCVASSGDHEKMQVTLGITGLWELFAPDIFSATEVARGKPHPDLFLHAAERMGVMPQACAVIEDSPYGIRAAKAAGMTAFGYVGGELAKALSAEGAVEFDHMERLPQLLG